MFLYVFLQIFHLHFAPEPGLETKQNQDKHCAFEECHLSQCHIQYWTDTDKSDVDKTGVLAESLKLKKLKKPCVVSAAMKIEEVRGDLHRPAKHVLASSLHAHLSASCTDNSDMAPFHHEVSVHSCSVEQKCNRVCNGISPLCPNGVCVRVGGTGNLGCLEICLSIQMNIQIFIWYL